MCPETPLLVGSIGEPPTSYTVLSPAKNCLSTDFDSRVESSERSYINNHKIIEKALVPFPTTKYPSPHSLNFPVSPSTGRRFLLTEAASLISIALPCSISQLAQLLIWTETAAAIGKVDLSTDHLLASFSLTQLIGNSSCLSLVVGVLSASDTLMPQAFGAGNFHDVGILVVRSTILSVLVILPLLMLWLDSVRLENLLVQYGGQNREISHYAVIMIRCYYVPTIPSIILWNVLQRYITSTRVNVWPLVVIGSISCVAVHPTLLRYTVTLHSSNDMYSAFENGLPGPLAGAGIAILITQYFQAFALLIFVKLTSSNENNDGLNSTLPDIFDRTTWIESLQIGPVKVYAKLAIGGIMSLSEWWYWEALTFIAGQIGVASLTVHTIAYQLVPLLFMIPLGISIGISVRLGTLLSSSDNRQLKVAKTLVAWCFCFSVILSALVATAIYFFRYEVIGIFTVDEEVIQGCDKIWKLVSVFIFLDGLFGINSGILRALGLQRRMGIAVVLVLWCTSIPLVYYLSVFKGLGLSTLWTIVPPTYLVLNTVLIFSFTCADWGNIRLEICRREGVDI